MDPRLLDYYKQELQHLRETGAEFAQQFEKIAARLGMTGTEVNDPYVERLLEGVAFMAARVQLKLDAEFPRFTQKLLEMVYPNYLAPVPAMLIARLEPDLNDANLARGFSVPRHTGLIGQMGRGEKTACEFRTAHEVTLWPLELTHAEYFSYAPDLPLGALKLAQRVKGGVRLRLRSTGGVAFSQLALDRLRLFIPGSGNEQVAYKLHELCLGACAGVLLRPLSQESTWYELLDATRVRPVGYEDEEALLPPTLRTFQGYRLLQEYFAFPRRYLFMDVEGLGTTLRRHAGSELEVVLLFSRGEAFLESGVDTASFALFCTPAINLFTKSADRIHLTDSTHSYHVVPDRTRPMDFEVYEVTGVTGYGTGSEGEQPFVPFYATYHHDGVDRSAYYTVQREPRLASESQKRTGKRTAYLGTEVYVALVDPAEAPYRSDLRQLAVDCLCTNRDLPLQLPRNVGNTDFDLDTAAPVLAVRCIGAPTESRSPLGEGNAAWRFISHLSLNYLSLLDSGEAGDEGAVALRQILALYAGSGDSVGRQIGGVRGVRLVRSVRRLPLTGPLAYGRGIEIELDVDELAFQGGSAFLFGAVMSRFFARHASINSFTETVLRSPTRGEIMRWLPRCGERPIV